MKQQQQSLYTPDKIEFRQVAKQLNSSTSESLPQMSYRKDLSQSASQHPHDKSVTEQKSFSQQKYTTNSKTKAKRTPRQVQISLVPGLDQIKDDVCKSLSFTVPNASKKNKDTVLAKTTQMKTKSKTLTKNGKKTQSYCALTQRTSLRQASLFFSADQNERRNENCAQTRLKGKVDTAKNSNTRKLDRSTNSQKKLASNALIRDKIAYRNTSEKTSSSKQKKSARPLGHNRSSNVLSSEDQSTTMVNFHDCSSTGHQ